MNAMYIKIFTTGGTIDKIYFDAKSEFEVGESLIHQILADGRATFDFDVESLMRKDSLEITNDDRQLLFERVSREPHERVVITHGTDTLTKTADALKAIERKTIVLTGSLSPARFRNTDAVFNIALAVASVQIVQPGVYIAMNGRVFPAGTVRKNSDLGCFEEIEPN